MKFEYVGLTYPEKVYIERNFLQSQLELLDSVKRLKEYKKLRKQELVLKIALKRAVREGLEELRALEKVLPKVEYGALEDEEDVSLKEEVEEIRRKLNALSS